MRFLLFCFENIGKLLYKRKDTKEDTFIDIKQVGTRTNVVRGMVPSCTSSRIASKEDWKGISKK